MHYPETVLGALEREPIVYFGCTWTEIIRAIWRGFLATLVVTFILLVLPTPISKAILIIPFFGVWAYVTKITMGKIRKLRTGKPLHYERHVHMVRRKGLFINPDDFKQCERNQHGRLLTHA